ncbi:MAG TPA: hypothetical protein VK699_02735 [Terriglobales bacterium]|jgi:adenosylhomocysteine nucleosidase|nr:hypothetical protein [Terriglobales bacterium]
MSGPNNSKIRHARFAIVAALRQEVSAVVRGWGQREIEYGGRKLRFYESEKAVLVCGGIGAQAANIAAQAALICYRPQGMLSAGVAGSLSSNLNAGEAFLVSAVIDAVSGKTYAALLGTRRLVTAGKILGPEEKRELAQRYSAHAVDMEAAAVAEVAAQAGLPFYAAKAISDQLDFPMPPMDRFVDASGNFATGKFVLHAALRPAMWPVVWRLARNNHRAAEALARVVQPLIDGQNLHSDAIESGIAQIKH